MSIEAVTWALGVPVGGNAKVILLGLANHAHPDGSETYPALDTLAGYAHCDRSTARRNVRKLVSDGWAIEDGLGPRGQMKYRLPLAIQGGGKTPRVQNATGGISAHGGVAPMPPEPSIEPSKGKEERERARDERKNSIPDDFPDHLRPHAREVMRVLRSVAEDHGAKRVWPQEVARAIMAKPRHPLVAVAHELAAWAVDPKREIKDVVGTYRTFLKRERELEATERLADDGTPTTGRPAMPGNVTPLHGRRMSAAEQVEANIQALRADL